MEVLEPPNRPIFIVLTALGWAAATGLLFWLLPGRLSGVWLGAWIAALFVSMALVDFLYCRWWRRNCAPDPMEFHWSDLTNRDGNYVCAACRSIHLLPPPDLDLDKNVTCGDCGHVVAPYGEMQPYLHALGEEKMWAMNERGPRWW